MERRRLETVALSPDGRAVIILDQTLLPGKVEYAELTTQEAVWDAIRRLRVRGAPAIGVAAALGLYMGALEIEAADYEEFYIRFTEKKDYLATARPTAVNLFWALERMERCVKRHAGKPVREVLAALHREALAVLHEDAAVCGAIGAFGAELLREGMGVLTHCNAGALATAGCGTALAPVYVAMDTKGYKNLKVFCCETRPLLQGARLTATELVRAGVDATLICDNMASAVMKNGWVQAVFVGCDRVAANGDAANKIGTSGVAILAKHYGVPFYVCAPTSTIDMETPTGDGIDIELRAAAEVTDMWFSRRMAPEGVKVYNPAFDVTDAGMITGIVTERGVIRPPYPASLKSLFE